MGSLKCWQHNSRAYSHADLIIRAAMKRSRAVNQLTNNLQHRSSTERHMAGDGGACDGVSDNDGRDTIGQFMISG